MEQLRNKQLVILTLISFGLGWTVWGILKHYQNLVFHGYVLIPILFFFYGFVLILSLHKIDTKKPQKIARLYLLMHLVKLVLFGILAFVFILAFNQKSKTFILVFGGYYLVLTVLETLIFRSFEKQLKKEKLLEKL
ncbi:MAG: hypothetical protein AUK44_09885 [Porphyromonadaceae bacterium CG2_30_38_12]|nr:MAG: hypothetical protein AUK44_09885 [Porphyromonadaceae bacterium CG2_30_38_12]